MTEMPETVAVPVAMIEAAASQIPGSALASQFRYLLPKPTPRLVAFDFDDWAKDPRNLKTYIESQPDLLTLLDEAVRSVLDVDRVALVMDRIRAALGVSA